MRRPRHAVTEKAVSPSYHCHHPRSYSTRPTTDRRPTSSEVPRRGPSTHRGTETCTSLPTPDRSTIHSRGTSAGGSQDTSGLRPAHPVEPPAQAESGIDAASTSGVVPLAQVAGTNLRVLHTLRRRKRRGSECDRFRERRGNHATPRPYRVPALRMMHLQHRHFAEHIGRFRPVLESRRHHDATTDSTTSPRSTSTGSIQESATT